jgi:cysteine desulfurase
MNSPIYLDYAATTPVDPRVAAKMWKYLSPDGVFANSSSAHSMGKIAKDAIDHARTQVALVIEADACEIIWTSGATEANNLALKGAAGLYQRKGKHIITLTTEHSSVLDVCQHLEKQGYFVTYLSPEKTGLVDINKLKAAIRPDTIMVSIMAVNNETGIIQDLDAIGALTRSEDILLHVDAVQCIGKHPLSVKTTPIDLMSLSAHKVYGPKGIGALYVRQKPRIRVAAQIHGGGQEQGMRSGTLPTHQIVGMGEAFELTRSLWRDEIHKMARFKAFFWENLHKIEGVKLNCEIEHTVPHILNIRFPGIQADFIMAQIPDLAISKGSACDSKGNEPSYVLRALGLSREEAQCSLRFSFGRFLSEAQLSLVIKEILKILSIK